MNKELSPLEAFRIVMKNCSYHKCWEELDIIQTTLKRTDELEERCYQYQCALEDIEERSALEHHAIAIIKEKRVNLEYLKCCETYEQYKTICSYWNEITPEEFDLLKEVLL